MASPLSSFFAPVVHPIFVHFTAALFPTVALLASFAAWRRAEWAATATRWVLGLALAITLGTITTGIIEHHPYEEKIAGTPTSVILVWHEWLGISTEILFALAFVLLVLRPRALTTRRATVELVLLWSGVALVTIGGWLGGRLVYEFGLGTPGGP